MESERKCRCFWVNEDNIIQTEYHDKEWGVPVYDDALLFEMLILESFQAGLSWNIILNKREEFRKAFDGFDVVKISQYSDEKVQKLLQNQGIVRSESKINAAISNAQAFIKIQEEYGTFCKYIWSFSDNKIIKNIDDLIPTHNEISDMIAKDMKKRGFKYMGSVTVYSYLAAIGIFNNHETQCFKYREE